MFHEQKPPLLLLCLYPKLTVQPCSYPWTVDITVNKITLIYAVITIYYWDSIDNEALSWQVQSSVTEAKYRLDDMGLCEAGNGFVYIWKKPHVSRQYKSPYLVIFRPKDRRDSNSSIYSIKLYHLYLQGSMYNAGRKSSRPIEDMFNVRFSRILMVGNHHLKVLWILIYKHILPLLYGW